MKSTRTLRRIASGLCTGALGLFAAGPAQAVDASSPGVHARGSDGALSAAAGTYSVNVANASGNCGTTLVLANTGVVSGTLADGSTVTGTWSAAGSVGGPPTYRFEVTQVHTNGSGKVVGYTRSRGTFTHDASTHHLDGTLTHEHQDANHVVLRSEAGTFKGDRK
jgi:hypothetical protein